VTQIDKEAAERWNCWIDDLPLDKDQWSALDELQQFIRAMSDALEAAEARERAAVAAKVEEIADRVTPLLGQYIADDVLPCYDIESEVYLMDPEAGQANAAFVDHAIRTLSDTDALAEYVERAEAVRAIEAARQEAQAEIIKNANDTMPSRRLEDLYLGRKIGLEMALAVIKQENF
jgi:hypothetical protein